MNIYFITQVFETIQNDTGEVIFTDYPHHPSSQKETSHIPLPFVFEPDLLPISSRSGSYVGPTLLNGSYVENFYSTGLEVTFACFSQYILHR